MTDQITTMQIILDEESALNEFQRNSFIRTFRSELSVVNGMLDLRSRGTSISKAKIKLRWERLLGIVGIYMILDAQALHAGAGALAKLPTQELQDLFASVSARMRDL